MIIVNVEYACNGKDLYTYKEAQFEECIDLLFNIFGSNINFKRRNDYINYRHKWECKFKSFEFPGYGDTMWEAFYKTITIPQNFSKKPLLNIYLTEE